MNAEVRYAKESPKLINFAETFRDITKGLSRAYTVPDEFYEQPASMERFEKGISINNAQEFLDHTIYDADKAAGIVEGFAASQKLKDVGMTISVDQLVNMSPNVKKTMGRSLTIAALAHRAARLESLLSSNGIPEVYATAQTQTRKALNLVERAARLAYDWSPSWGKLSVDNALKQAGGTVTRQKVAQASMTGILALAGCGPISVSFTPEATTGQGTTPRSTEVVPAMTETAVLMPTVTAESTQPGELTCSVEVQSELFNNGITDNSRTVPVLSGAGFTEVFGSDVPLVGITNQIANDVAGLVQTAPEGIARVVIPDGIRPEDVISGVSQLTGNTQIPFEIAPYENGMVLSENDMVVAVHAGKGGWTTGVWKEASLTQDEAGRNQINGLLLESAGGIYTVIPAQRIDNGRAAIVIVDGCGPSIVRAQGNTVAAILDPGADIINDLEHVWIINPVPTGVPTETPTPTETPVPKPAWQTLMETQDPQDRFFYMVDGAPTINPYDTEAAESIVLVKETITSTVTTDIVNPVILTARDAAGAQYAFNPDHGWFALPEVQMNYADLSQYTQVEENFFYDGRNNIVRALTYANGTEKISPDAHPVWWITARAVNGRYNLLCLSFFPVGMTGVAERLWPTEYFTPGIFYTQEDKPFVYSGFYKVTLDQGGYIYVIDRTIYVDSAHTLGLANGYDSTTYENMNIDYAGPGSSSLDIIIERIRRGQMDFVTILPPPEQLADGTPISFDPATAALNWDLNPVVASLQGPRGSLISIFSPEDQKRILDVLAEHQHEEWNVVNPITAPLTDPAALAGLANHILLTTYAVP